MTLEFSNLPLMQVELRLTVALEGSMTVPLGIRLHGELADQYPIPVQMDQVTVPPGRPLAVGLDGASVGAIGFGQESPRVLAVIQQDLVSIRWFRTSEPNDYPRFPEMLDRLSQLVAKLGGVVGCEVQPLVSQIRYLNFIASRDLPAGGVFGALRRDLSLPDTIADGLSKLDIEWSSDGVDLRVLVQEGRRLGGPAEPGFVLETVAGAFIVDEAWTRELTKCHDKVVAEFERLLSEDIKAKWGLEGRS